MPPAILPVELAEQIIDFFSQDRRTLLACSRVASGWRPRALSYLFRSIQIRSGFTKFTFGVTRVYGPRYFARFHKTMPHLLLYLRHLTFFGSDDDRDLLAFAGRLVLPPPFCVEVVTFAGSDDWYNALHGLSTRIPSLRHLTVERLGYLPPQALPPLDATSWDFGLIQAIGRSTIVRLLPAGANQASLQSLTLRMLSGFALLDLGIWLSSLHAVAPNLQSVEIVQSLYSLPVDEEDIASFVVNTEDCCHLIHSLKLTASRWNRWENPHAPAESLNGFLGHCRRLRVLEFKVSHVHSEFRRETFPQLTGPFPLLERLNVILDHFDPMAAVYLELPQCDWRALEEMLLSRAPRFNCFSFIIAPFSPGRNSSWKTGIWDAASAALPGLRKEGKLNVLVQNA